MVFLIDESGSMGPIQEGIRQNVSLIGTRLHAAIDAQFGIVGFGALQPTTPPGDPHAQRPLSDDLSQLDAGLAELRTAGVSEPGYDAVALAVDNLMGFRPGAGVCAVLIGDAEAQSNNVSHSEALAALEARHATLFAVVDPTIAQGYVDLAVATGGSAFDIRTFAANPQPLLAAILDRCADEIVEDTDAPPTAVADTATTTQGSGPLAIDVLANDTDTDGGPKSIASATQPANGSVTVAADGLSLSYRPNPGYCNTAGSLDTFTYTLAPGSSTATVAMTVSCLNQPPALDPLPANAGVQYSDPLDGDPASNGIQPLVLSAKDPDGPSSELVFSIDETRCSGGQTLPAGLALVDNGDGSATIEGRLGVRPGTYTPCVVVSDGAGTRDAATLTITVTKEDVSIVDLGPGFVQVEGSDGDADAVTLTGTFVEDADGFPSADIATYAAAYADTRVAFLLGPIESTASDACTDTGIPTPSSAVGCVANNVPSEMYEIGTEVQGDWFTGGGLGFGLLAVFDPASGFSTGGGRFAWSAAPGPWSDAAVSFGFTGKKVKKSVKGSVVMVIHTAAGPYVIKSNALTGIANARVRDETYWYASMTGKGTYAVPDGSVNPYCVAGERKCGSFTFLLYSEDRGEPGAGSDTYRLRLSAPDKRVVFDTALHTLSGGNVQVPHG
ncbi:MAG TPA: Ig-like domain-containing protein [Gemmatimonadota bacterium]|nr:Ig-like domain-containing protein [Gemmatimonadota bacterium]